MPNIIIKLDVTKIPREAIFQGKKGKYVDLVVYENEAEDEYGNTHAVTISQTKEQRQAKDRKIYVGNGKWMQFGGGQPQRQAPAPRPQQRQAPPPRPHQEPADYADDSDEIPF